MNIENAILKQLINDPIYFNKVHSLLNDNKVFDSTNQIIYNIINEFYGSYNKAPNLTEIALKLKDIPNKEQRVKLAEQLKEIRDSENINKDFILDETVKYVKDQVFTEAMMIGADFIDTKKESLKIKARELMEKAAKISIDQDIGLDYNDIEKRIDYYQNPASGLLYKRFHELNKRLGGGYLPGTLNLFLAAAGVGKSLIMSTSITDFIQQGKNVLLVSMEMSDFEFVKRIDADNLDLPINDLKNIPREVILDKFYKSKDSLGKLYTKQYPAGTFSSSMLEALLDMYENQENIKFDVVFLDYVGIMKSDRVSPSIGLYLYIKAINEEVRAVAVKRNITIISASQLNRGSVNSTEGGNEKISDSMGTAMTADFLLFVMQTEEMKTRNEFLFKVTKNRYTGITDHFIMNVDYSKMRIKDPVQISSKEQADEIEHLVQQEIKESCSGWDFS
nr:MAG TPA: DnaB-like replicative helicase [Caudoviricetes sp.]